MKFFFVPAFLLLTACASGTAGTGLINGQAVSVEITEVTPSGIIVNGYSLKIDGEYIGTFDCDGACSSGFGREAPLRMGPLVTKNGTYKMQRIIRANMIFFEVSVNGEFIGTIRFL